MAVLQEILFSATKFMFLDDYIRFCHLKKLMKFDLSKQAGVFRVVSITFLIWNNLYSDVYWKLRRWSFSQKYLTSEDR